MDGKHHRIVIVGGGIGGLTAAVALAQRGHEVEVLERAPELKPVGAGLTLQINAMKVLARLGLAEQVAAAGSVIRHSALINWDGTVLSDMDMAPLCEELGAPQVGVHRAELHRVLVQALGSVPLRLGAPVRGFHQDERGVTVLLEDGTTRAADAVIAADGIHSALRAQLHGRHEPEYAGYTCWRGVLDNRGVADPHTISESWGDAKRFGLVPVGPGRLYWFAVADAPAGEKDGPDPRAELLERFRGWHPEVVRALEATPREAIFRMDIADRPVLHRWGEGRVTLLGDAAHPMTPNLGQGACMAIEDALVLASALSEKADPAEALRLYEARRQERTGAVVETARRFGRMGQWSSPIARAVRNAVVHATPAQVTERQMRWLYAYEA